MFYIYTGPILDVLIGKNSKYIIFEKALLLQGYLFQTTIETRTCVLICFHIVLCTMIAEITISLVHPVFH